MRHSLENLEVNFKKKIKY